MDTVRLSLITDTIRNTVSAYQAAEALGLRPDRHGRCACPVHHGTDRNCRLWKDDRGFYCYVCKKGGDVIRLVETVNCMSFSEAVAWLNSAFQLGLDLDSHDDKRTSERALRAKEWRSFCREQDQRTDRMQYEAYLDVGQYVTDLERDKEAYRPTKWNEEWDERFVAALRNLPDVREMAVEAAMTVIK